jgi:hypothetical protein
LRRVTPRERRGRLVDGRVEDNKQNKYLFRYGPEAHKLDSDG